MKAYRTLDGSMKVCVCENCRKEMLADGEHEGQKFTEIDQQVLAELSEDGVIKCFYCTESLDFDGSILMEFEYDDQAWCDTYKELNEWVNNQRR
jgi:hypothetical protein